MPSGRLKQLSNILDHFNHKLQKIEIGFYSYRDGRCFISQIGFVNSYSPNSFQLIELQDYLNLSVPTLATVM